MRYLWSRLIMIFLLGEVLLFVVYYKYGPRGIDVLRNLKEIKLAAQSDIKNLEQKNNDLRDEIEEWKSDLFLQEKFAREKLALQKENEIIYFR
jgi:cell division protein FtsB